MYGHIEEPLTWAQHQCFLLMVVVGPWEPSQVATIPWAQRLLAQNTAFRHVEQHRKQTARTFAFPIDEAWPPDIKKWVTKWSMNPISLPHPIHQDEHGLPNQDDIDVWLWLWAVIPDHNPKGVFNHALWPISQQPGR